MNRPPKAIIFDMDETLVATGRLWKKAETALLNRVGERWSPELASKYKGMNALDVAKTIHREFQPDLSVEECQSIMRDVLIEGFRSGDIREMPGASACVARAAQIAPLALASGSPLESIVTALTALGIIQHFTHLISSESVARGKPHPDVFLAAADALQTPPQECLVFEDTIIGTQAALAAQMSVFLIPSTTQSPPSHPNVKAFASLDHVSSAHMNRSTQCNLAERLRLETLHRGA